MTKQLEIIFLCFSSAAMRQYVSVQQYHVWLLVVCWVKIILMISYSKYINHCVCSCQLQMKNTK